VVSQKKEDVIKYCSVTSNGSVSFQDPGCDAEEDACLKVDCMELVDYLSDGGSFEVDLVNQITESYKNHEASGWADSLDKVWEGINTVRNYIDYKNELFDDPAFTQACENFDFTVMPITYMNIIAALVEHPLPSPLEWHLSDKLIYSSSLMINNPSDKKSEKSFYTAQASALAHFHTTSEWSFPEEMTHELPMTLVHGMAVILEACTLQETLTILPRSSYSLILLNMF